MFKKTIFSLLFIVLSLNGMLAQDLNSKLPLDPQLKTGQLDNGLTFYIRQNQEPKSRIELRLVINAGSICETDDQQGLAHLLEHMCFNGTEHFKKSALVDFIEASGVKFGAHLNASTSFDQTIYMLQMPSNRYSLVDSALLVLEDWAHNVRLEGDEIDKERGVVKEEWRLGLGAQDRMMKQYIPVILKGSRYAQRLPIGKMAVIDTSHYEAIRSFYRDWYRPDLMAVIVVGDAQPDTIQHLIEKHFGKLTNPSHEKERVIYGIPNNKEPLVAIAKDKEATNNQAVVFYKHPKKKVKTLGDFRDYLTRQLYNQMMASRLSEITQKPTAPFIYAGAAYGSFLGRTTDAYTAFALPKDNQIEKALKVLLDEDKRVLDYGFTKTEFERQLKNLKRTYERAYAEKNKTNSKRLIQEYVNHFLTQAPVPGIENEFKMAEKLLPEIQLDEVNQLAKQWITDSNMVVLITAPDKEGVEVPDEAAILNLIKNEKTVQLKPYVEKVLSAPLLTRQPKAGSITKIEKTDHLYQKWTLSNGIEVYVKPTHFKNDEVLYRAYSAGGSSLLPDNKVVMTRVFSNIIDQSGLGQFSGIDLQKKLSGKAVELTPFMSSLQHGFKGNASPKDLETLFQLQYLYFTHPRQDEEIFKKEIDNFRNQIKHLSANPQMVFYDSLYQTVNMHSPRVIVIPTEKQVNNIRRSDLYFTYKKLYEHAAGFKVFIVGNVDTNQLKVLVSKYLASIPAGKGPLNWEDRSTSFPKGVRKVEVLKGSEPQSQVAMVMKGKYKFGDDNNLIVNALVQSLNIELREKVREEESGTYGIYVSPSLNKFPKPEYSLMLGFGCAPENVDRLVQSVFTVMDKMKKQGPDALTLKKVKETFIRSHESDVRKNSYWLTKLIDHDFEGLPINPDKTFTSKVDALSTAVIRKAAKKYLTEKHYVLGILKPEK
jgi:zinc protease